MGSLILPSSGSVYLDANAIIYSYERVAPYSSLLDPCWNAAGPGSFEIVTSELTFLEVLVGPLKTGNTRLEAGFRALLLSSTDVTLIPIDRPVLERAAQLRAATSLKTPDAIHAATALEHGCASLITNDPAFRRVVGLTVQVLNDLLAP